MTCDDVIMFGYTRLRRAPGDKQTSCKTTRVSGAAGDIDYASGWEGHRWVKTDSGSMQHHADSDDDATSCLLPLDHLRSCCMRLSPSYGRCTWSIGSWRWRSTNRWTIWNITPSKSVVILLILLKSRWLNSTFFPLFPSSPFPFSCPPSP